MSKDRDAADSLQVLVRQRDAALRDLDRFDAADKGSRWLTHPDEGARLVARLKELDAAVEESATLTEERMTHR